nr:MAG TPA: hypothetical protein [Caudoviricetes sp.]
MKEHNGDATEKAWKDAFKNVFGLDNAATNVTSSIAGWVSSFIQNRAREAGMASSTIDTFDGTGRSKEQMARDWLDNYNK